jgi:hypothetical protein
MNWEGSGDKGLAGRPEELLEQLKHTWLYLLHG